jgi:hypothetical protein
LDSSDGGIWDTEGGTLYWTLGAASNVNATLYNQGNDGVNFTVTPGGSFVIFASEWFLGQPFPNGLFLPGKQFVLTIGFSDGSSTTVNTTISTPTDNVPPDTNIVSGPSGTISVGTAAFIWSGSDNMTAVGNLVYAYRLDPLEPAFSAFGSATTVTYSNLSNGNYTFLVKARDQAGNEDLSPASRAFTVNVPQGSIALTYNGTQRDRVRQANQSQAGDGQLDPTFTVSFPTGGSVRTVTSVRLDSSDGGIWDTNAGTPYWTLGVASDVNAGLLNQGNDGVNFTVSPGGSFVVFASEWSLGQP